MNCCAVINFLNANSGATSAILSVLSIISAFIAIGISISVAKKQARLNLFEKRYKVYELFSQLVEKAEAVSRPSLSYKYHLIMWCIFPEDDSMIAENFKAFTPEEFDEHFSQEGAESTPVDIEQFEQKLERIHAASIKLDKMFRTQKNVLQMARYLYNKKISDKIDAFINIYGTAVLIIGRSKQEAEKLWDEWYKLCRSIRQEKILEAMGKKLRFQK